MAWPDFVPVPTPQIPFPVPARRMLDQIVMRSEGWLATHPQDPPETPIVPPPAIPASERQRWQRIHDDALQCYVNQPAHHHHGDFIDTAGNAAPGERLDTPWEQVRQCRMRVLLAAPTMFDLEMAIDYIDHLGGGGAPAAPLTLMPPAVAATGRWPDFRPRANLYTARTILDAILSDAVGALGRPGLPSAMRASYLELLRLAFLDRSNVAHDYLRKLVRPDGRAAQVDGLRTAWRDAAEALELLNGYTVTASHVEKACRKLKHKH